MVIARVYKKPTRPYLFDRVIQDLQDALSELSWLTHIFGRCERLVKIKDGVRCFTPNVYYGKDEYIQLLPDNKALGNYCFFVMEEPQTVSVPFATSNRLKAPFSFVVWFDMRTVGATYDDRNTEQLKEQVLKTLRRGWLKHGAITLERVYERAENVFNGFSLNEVDNQFLMSPFAGFRVTGEMQIDEECDN
jgi:hypothetical protein